MPRGLAKNVVYSASTSLADALLLLLLIFAARLLGARDFGTFSFALAAASILTFFTNLGLDSLSIREIALDRTRAPGIIGRVIGWKILVSIVVETAFLLIAYSLTSNRQLLDAMLWLSIAALLRSFNMTLRSFLQAFERFDLETRAVVLERVLLFGLGLLALNLVPGAVTLAAVFVLARLLGTVIYAATIHARICRLTPHLDWAFVRRFQMHALPLGAAVVIFGVYAQLDVLLLGALKGPSDVGLFSAPAKLYEGLLVVGLVINSVIYPRLSQLSTRNAAAMDELYARGLKYMAVAGALVTVIGMRYGTVITGALFGSQYVGAGIVLALLLGAVSLRFCISTAFTFYRSLGAHKTVMYLSLLGLAAKLVGDLVLIPALGARGAATTVLASEAVILAAALIATRAFGHRIPWRTVAAVRIAFAAAAAWATGAALAGVGLEVQIPAVALTYLAALALLRVFDRTELSLIRSLAGGGRTA